MTNFNEWQCLLITGKIRENVDGWEAEIGSYLTIKESMAAVEEYKERVEKLVKLERDLF